MHDYYSSYIKYFRVFKRTVVQDSQVVSSPWLVSTYVLKDESLSTQLSSALSLKIICSGLLKQGIDCRVAHHVDETASVVGNTE